MEIVLILTGLAAFVFFLGKFLVSYATRWTSRFVGSQMQDAEYVLQTGRIPHRWLTGRGRTRTKRNALLRLDRLVKHFERTPFVETEAVRTELIKRLDRVLDNWEESAWDQIAPDDDLR